MSYGIPLTSPTLDFENLLSKHYRRFTKSRGSFGIARKVLIAHSHRWQWYSSIMLLKEIPTEPLPQMDFVDDHDSRAKKLVMSLLNINTSLDDVLNYLLHVFGHPGFEEPPKTEISFPIEEALLLDRDLFGDVYSEVMGNGLRSGTGYFPTPQNICNMMIEMTMADCELTNTVNDPCVGSGRMLLSASNKSLFLSGNDVNPTCVKMTLVNGYFFAPWIALPPPKEIIPLRKHFNLERNIYGKNTFSL